MFFAIPYGGEILTLHGPIGTALYRLKCSTTFALMVLEVSHKNNSATPSMLALQCV